MGAGKTTVGRILAETWGVGFRDTDQDVEAAAGPLGLRHLRGLGRGGVPRPGARGRGDGAGGPRRRAGPRRWRRPRPEHPRTARRAPGGVPAGRPERRRPAGRASASPGRCCSATCAAGSSSLIDERTPVYESVATASWSTPTGSRSTRWSSACAPRSRMRPMSEDQTRMHVGGASPYDVVVGHGVLDELPRRARARRAPGRGLPPRVARRRSPTRCVRRPRRRRAAAAHAPRRRGRQDGAGGRRRVGAARAGRLHPLRRGRHRRRRRDHRRRRLRRRDLAARRARRARADDAARHGRRGGRRQDRHQHRRRQEPRRLLPRAGRRALRPRPARLAARRPSWSPASARWSSAASSPTPRSSASSRQTRRRSSTPPRPQLREVVERAIQVKIDVVVGDLKETGGADGHPGSRGAQLRPHDGARDREGHRLPRPARRGRRARHGLRRRARPAGRPPRRRDGRAARRGARPRSGCRRGSTSCPFEDLLATMRVDKKSRGSMLRFVVLDGLASPAMLADPSEDAPAGGVRRAEGRMVAR